MRIEDGHPDVSLEDWQCFISGQLVCGPLSLINEIIDRSECCIPDWFVPLARGAAVASEKLLRDVGYRPGMPRTGHWFEFRPNCCTRLGFDCLSFEVRKCEGTNLWTVERHNIDGGRHDEEVLVHVFGSTLIVTGICESAEAARYVLPRARSPMRATLG